jgi:branched-chain amino acid transport system ATP-binding protein
MNLLEVDSLGKNFGGVRALDHVSLQVAESETVGLMGANGAGKTTLFSIIAGHAKPSTGSIRFKGKSITGYRPDKICRLGIARTFQIVRPFAGMSVLENVEVAILFGDTVQQFSSSLADEAISILNAVGLADIAYMPAGELTLSARKRLEVARAIATRPAILLLDEVMAGLTPREVDDMIDIIRRIKIERQLSIVIVEHVVKALNALSERIVVLHHGQVIAEGSPEEIADHADVRKAYFGEARE